MVEYSEDNSPYTRKYIVTYSTKDDFSTYSTLKTSVYLHEVIGVEAKHLSSIGFVYSTTKEIQKNKQLSRKFVDGINDFTIEGYYSIASYWEK